MKKRQKNTTKLVSGPYRGMGGVLPKLNRLKSQLKTNFRPLSRYGWGPTFTTQNISLFLYRFPAPLEVWVGSYLINSTQTKQNYLRFRPLSRYGWGPTNKMELLWFLLVTVSVPSRGMSGFLHVW